VLPKRGAVRGRGVIAFRDARVSDSAGVISLRIPDAADDLGWSFGPEQVQGAGPVSEAVRVDDAAGAVAEQGCPGKIPDRHTTGEGLMAFAVCERRELAIVWSTFGVRLSLWNLTAGGELAGAGQ
jgi:hypothetical protein